LPYDTIMHDQLHGLGFKTVYHICGGMTKILECIKANRCDVSETLSPAGMGGDINNDTDAKKVYDALHEHVGLIGGMDQFNILERGSKAEIENEVERLFNIFGKKGGYILSASDHFFEIPPENLKIFSAAAKKYVY
jgi:uroporphyrinogen-III decarboxylase